MPAEPKSKHSKAYKRTRRAAIKLNAVNLVICKNCGSKTLSHMACRECGFYAGQKVKEIVKVTKA